MRPHTWISSKPPTFKVETFRSPSEVTLVEAVILVSLRPTGPCPGGACLAGTERPLDVPPQVVLTARLANTRGQDWPFVEINKFLMFLCVFSNRIFTRRDRKEAKHQKIFISFLLACFEHGDSPEFPLSEKQPRIPFFFLLSRTWSSLSLMQYCSLMSSMLYTGTTDLLLPFWRPWRQQWVLWLWPYLSPFLPIAFSSGPSSPSDRSTYMKEKSMQSFTSQKWDLF